MKELLSETGIGAVAGGYMYVDGLSRIIGSLANIYGAVTGDEQLEKYPSNFLGLVGSMIDNRDKNFFNYSSKRYGGNWQLAGETIGDFTLAKRDAAIAMEKWLTSPSTLNLLDIIYNSVEPWVNTFINYMNKK